MKKRLMMILMLILCAVLLCACSGEDGTRYDTKGNSAETDRPLQPGQPGYSQQNNNLYEGMDPLAEEDDLSVEDYWPELEAVTPTLPQVTEAPTVRSEYAGATPVVIDPIDKPTPTPVPKLAVTYTIYDATRIGLSFEGPSGWLKDDTASDTFIIQNPDARMDYSATLTLRKERVSSDYSTSDLKTLVRGMLDAIETAGFKDYNPSQTANRELLGKVGVYANYDGVLDDGTRIAGRVHAVCVDKVVYTLHLTAPYGQWEDYKDQVYDHLRDTIKINK